MSRRCARCVGVATSDAGKSSQAPTARTESLTSHVERSLADPAVILATGRLPVRTPRPRWIDGRECLSYVTERQPHGVRQAALDPRDRPKVGVLNAVGTGPVAWRAGPHVPLDL